jgi:hypothetical protein
MTANQKPLTRLEASPANSRSLATLVETSLRQGSGFSIALADATVGVSFDKSGDWTIAVGLSSRSNRFKEITMSLEGLGFFQATENEGAAYMLWTSLFTEVGSVRTSAEQTLLLALKVLQAPSVLSYIS